MKVVNIGSINIDTTFHVAHFVRPGETESANSVDINAGGKGLNQSVSLARAGCEVWHAGRIGEDGEWLRDLCSDYGINTDFLETVDTPTGNAVIRVTNQGENSILLFGGANQTIDMNFVNQVLQQCTQEDVIVLQNEISCMNEILTKIQEMGLRAALNPAPMNDCISPQAMAAAHWLILNETEAQELTGKDGIEETLLALRGAYPDSVVILTVGGDGVWYQDSGQLLHMEACKVSVKDTTAAGDTFTGYFLAEWLRTENVQQALLSASRAAAIVVSRKGAAESIPTLEEVQNCEFAPLLTKFY